MSASDKDPIVAVATAAGRGGVGIVRLSFPKDFDADVLDALFPGRSFTPRHAHLYPVLDASGELLDEAIVLHFPGPSSYTGESVLEIQAHGGPVLLRMIVRTVLEKCRHLHFRLAEPGEFTKRAFLNGRMDLAQAEAVSDLIDAVSESAAHAAVRSLSGDFSDRVRDVGLQVDELRAFVEAALDFPEEETDFLAEGRILERARSVADALKGVLDNAVQGRVLRDGISVTLVGSPNVGKSSLLNALAGEEVAIVTDVAGTTRDRIEHWVTVRGVPIRIVDTAGLRRTDDIVESKGIERTLEAASRADVVLHLVDASGGIVDEPEVLELVMRHVRPRTPLITVANKADAGRKVVPEGAVLISAKTRDGLEALREALLCAAGVASTTDGLFMARERHLEALRAALEHVECALRVAQDGGMMDLFAEELRLAGQALGSILGETTPDDLLGMIFSKFCIGK